MKIRVLQHAPHDRMGYLRPWFEQRGDRIEITKIHEGQDLPVDGNYDGLVVLGGPQGAYEEDRYSWMRPEKELIDRAIREEKKVLGICLGAQMIADVLGGSVYPHRTEEIGWYPVNVPSDIRSHPLMEGIPGEFVPLHWHGDTFDLPRNAVRLAGSEVCTNQGFWYGRHVLALQFHLEVRPEGLTTFLDVHREKAPRGPYVQSPQALRENANFQRSREILHRFLDRFVDPGAP